MLGGDLSFSHTGDATSTPLSQKQRNCVNCYPRVPEPGNRFLAGFPGEKKTQPMGHPGIQSADEGQGGCRLGCVWGGEWRWGARCVHQGANLREPPADTPRWTGPRLCAHDGKWHTATAHGPSPSLKAEPFDC